MGGATGRRRRRRKEESSSLTANLLVPRRWPVLHSAATDTLAIDEDAPVEHAAREMAVLKIGCLPVVTGDDEFIGMVTETDLLRHFAGLSPTD